MTRKHALALLPCIALILAAAACSQGTPPVIYVTATSASVPVEGSPFPNAFQPTLTPPGPTATAILPTPNPTYPPQSLTTSYTIQNGDTLATIAEDFGTTVDQILALNANLSATTTIYVGQVISVPGRPSRTTPNIKLIPDSELVNSPAVRGFDVIGYIKFQPGFIRIYSENAPVEAGQPARILSGAEIVQFVATSTSVNPRLLLALLEYRGHWITNPVPDTDALTYPLGLKDPAQQGLFKQLFWAANQLNAGYYGYKYRGLTTLNFIDAGRLAFAPELNPGTVALQYFLSQNVARATWQNEVALPGFFTTYMAMFGDPFRQAVEPLVPANIAQPTFQLPFKQGELWYFTSGPHGGWDNNSGWSAIDFAPPKPPDTLIASEGYCYVSPASAVAVVAGLIVRSGDGAVVIDTDMDGDERTGWTVTYLHIADEDRIKAGSVVEPGTPIGHPSCQGLYLNAVATHVHIARRYNGEWIAADCWACAPGVATPPFVLGGWTVKGYPNQVYQGWLENKDQVKRAEQGTDKPDSQMQW